MADETTLPAEKQKRQRLTIDQKIARLEMQAAKLRTQKSKRSRNLDARQKIIVGATVIKAMEDNGEWRERVSALLRDKVTREVDREAIAEWLSVIST